MLTAAAHALTIILDPMRLLIMLAGVVLGLFLGVIPGLGGIVGCAAYRRRKNDNNQANAA